MSNEMIIIIASPEARTEVVMSRSLNNANLKGDQNSPLNCQGALRYGTENDRYMQTIKHYHYPRGPEAKTYNPGFKRGTSQRTAKRTQGIYVYLNVCKMSTNFIDPDTEDAYNAEKVTLNTPL